MARPTGSAIRRGFRSPTAARTGIPIPVPLKVYDETIGVLKSAVQPAKLGREEKLTALQRLDDQARRLEHVATGPSLEAVIATERERSHSYGGRSVFGWEMPQASRAGGRRRLPDVTHSCEPNMPVKYQACNLSFVVLKSLTD